MEFANREIRTYDFKPLLETEAFWPLKDEAFFRHAQVTPGRYGVVWNDDVDISEAELWLNGEPAS